MLIMTAVLLVIFFLFTVLTKFAPQESDNMFWKLFSKNHKSMERIFTVLFICLLVISAALIGYEALNRSATEEDSSIATDAVVSIVLCIGYFCLKSQARYSKRGEVCECCGNCSKCRTQCRSNEKYYGVKQDKK